MFLIYLLTIIAIVLLAIILDWQKDRSSFGSAVKAHFLKYIGMAAGGWFLVGWLLSFATIRLILAVLVAIAVYFFWTLIWDGLVKLFSRASKPSIIKS